MSTVTGHVQLSINSYVFVNTPITFNSTRIDAGLIRTLLLIDNKPITNHNRTFEESINLKYIENKNWNNKKLRFYKNQTNAGKKTFNITWKFLPNFREKTVDYKYGRDFLKQIASDPDVHTITIINQDETGGSAYTETVYNVFITNYSETLIRRDLSDGVYYFDCSMSLEEA